MIATLNGTTLMVGKMRVATISHSPKGFKWHAIFGGGRSGRKFFTTFTEAIRACAKSCGLTVRVPASWEEVRVTYESEDGSAICKNMIARAHDFVGHNSVYGGDEILDAMAAQLRDERLVKNHNLYIHRGGHHVAICAGQDRLAMITAEDKEL